MRPGLLSDLVTIGYEIGLEGENIKLRYRKQDAPPEAAKALISELKACKAEVVNMLKTLNDTVSAKMDGILQKTTQDIQTGGYWKATPEVREIEIELDKLYPAVLAGKATVEDFRGAVLRWKLAGTRDLKQDHPDDHTDTWGESMTKLIEWFSSTTLPEQPFSISSYERILHPAKYYEALNHDIEAGPKGPRSRYGALQGDIERLRDYCKRRADT